MMQKVCRLTLKFSDTLRLLGEKCLKGILESFIALKMKLPYVIQIYKNIFFMINSLNSINILYTGSHKSFPIQYGLLWEIS